MEILSLGVLLAAFLLGLVLGAPYIRLLRHFRIGQNIRREGPQSHFAKQGTPTMGGALVIAVVGLLWLVVFAFLPEEARDDYVPQTIVPIGALLAVGLLGAIDDLVNVNYGFGIRGRHKLVWQALVALAGAIYIQRHFGVTGIFIPLVGEWEIGAAPFIVLAAVAIVGTSNGVNLTDGLDGLAGGTAVFAFLSFAFIA
ncbi:MAG: phospho-N-acetylmuramoyl-pentapeptide-transferase, partial [Chloroflexota bacterium]